MAVIDKELKVELPKDHPRLIDPEMAVVSDYFRSEWKKSGKSLELLAQEIDNFFDQLSGLDKHKLQRFLYAGYDMHNGLKGRQIFYPQARMIGEFFGVSPQELLGWMSSEKLRRFVIAELGKAGKSPTDLIAAMAGVLDRAEINELIAWLECRASTVDLNIYSGAIASALNKLTNDVYSGENIRKFLSDVHNGG